MDISDTPRVIVRRPEPSAAIIATAPAVSGGGHTVRDRRALGCSQGSAVVDVVLVLDRQPSPGLAAGERPDFFGVV
ncbi:hypothetical protein [Nocardia asiatica]|uniref:hypothetical protein n=1 Tax=Nocardia asiatica TaxID=209252 RepID=UPI002457CE62|nr:hypothetical protein [Nocardia asiatica]